MVSTSVVATKLFIPQVRPRRVARSRLVDSLNEGVSRKLTVVTAPAGYGKTTLLSEWANQSHIPVAWISLDGADNDEDRLVTYFVAAIQAVSEGSGMGEIVLAMRQSPQPLPLQTVIAAMINEMADYGQEFALVFDDYHAIDAQPVHELVDTILNYLPANVHLVIASRSIPPLPLARLRVRDELTELTTRDLKFATGEVETFLTDVMGLTLSNEDLRELDSRTEGWIASLQLAALSLKGRKDPSQVISQLTGAHRFILDYLAQEVLNDQHEALQEFLLKTSILENLSAPLCGEVTGNDDSQQSWSFLRLRICLSWLWIQSDAGFDIIGCLGISWSKNWP
jgi:LuxR family maltose regulon positive regulatory protein